MIDDFRCNNKTSGGGDIINLITWISLHLPLLNIAAAVVVMIGIAINNLLL